VNAILNYGITVLESQVQIAVVAAGLDPTIGFMHAHGVRRSAVVLDLMEPLRTGGRCGGTDLGNEPSDVTRRPYSEG
jgi:hypothetical protein